MTKSGICRQPRNWDLCPPRPETSVKCAEGQFSSVWLCESSSLGGCRILFLTTQPTAAKQPSRSIREVATWPPAVISPILPLDSSLRVPLLNANDFIIYWVGARLRLPSVSSWIIPSRRRQLRKAHLRRKPKQLESRWEERLYRSNQQ